MNMNGAHLHLILTHLPIVGMPLTLLLLLKGHLCRSSDNQRAALYAMMALAVITLLTNWTGEGAEQVLKGLPEYPRLWVHSHEEAADRATVATGITGLLALLQLFWKSTAQPLKIATVALAVLSTLLLGYTGLLGGQIRHTEVRTSASASGRDIGGPSGRE